jgi:hypothetical protein
MTIFIEIKLISGENFTGFIKCSDLQSYAELQKMFGDDFTKNQCNFVGLFIDKSFTKKKHWFIPSNRVEFISFEVAE